MNLDVDANENFKAEETPVVVVPETKAEETPIAKKVEDRPKAPPTLKAEESGLLVGGSLEEQYRLAKYYCNSRLLPTAFDTAEKVLTGMQFARELGLQPLSALRQICVINGSPSLWGDLPLAMVRKSGKLKWIKEIQFDKAGKTISRENENLDAEIYGAECVTLRDGDPDPYKTVFTILDAQKAGLLDKNKSLYKLYPKRMIQMRARSQNLKDQFGDVLLGAPIAEYDHHIDPSVEEKFVESGVVNTDPGSKLNERFRKPKDPEVLPKESRDE